MHYKQSLSQDKPGLPTILPVPMLDLLHLRIFQIERATRDINVELPATRTPFPRSVPNGT